MTIETLVTTLILGRSGPSAMAAGSASACGSGAGGSGGVVSLVGRSIVAVAEADPFSTAGRSIVPIIRLSGQSETPSPRRLNDAAGRVDVTELSVNAGGN